MGYIQTKYGKEILVPTSTYVVDSLSDVSTIPTNDYNPGSEITVINNGQVVKYIADTNKTWKQEAESGATATQVKFTYDYDEDEVYCNMTYSDLLAVYNNNEIIIPYLMYDGYDDYTYYGYFLGIQNDTLYFYIAEDGNYWTITYESDGSLDYDYTTAFDYKYNKRYGAIGYEYRFTASSSESEYAYFTWDGNTTGLDTMTFNGYTYYRVKTVYPSDTMTNCYRPFSQILIREDYDWKELTIIRNNTFDICYLAYLNTYVTTGFIPLIMASSRNQQVSFSYGGDSYTVTFPSAGIWIVKATNPFQYGTGDIMPHIIDLRTSNVYPSSGAFTEAISESDIDYNPEDTTKTVTPYVGLDGYIHFKITSSEPTYN